MQKLWVNLEKFGIEMKKIQTPDGNAFPLMIVNDVEKYNNSGALSLEVLKDPDNETGFIKLPGERKGRNSNTPMYMLTKSAKNGVEEYSIKSSLSNLLNISEEAVKQLYVQKEESEFVEQGSYADFQKLNHVLEQSTQRFYGSILYVVKEKGPTENLIDFSQKLIEKQHGLFPKNTVENIPFRTLDAFGLNSSIVDKAFMNPDDALKQGYTLNHLNSVKLYGDRAVLPVSINSDNSVNVILDPQKLSPLAYTNYNWQKNFPLIEDYNAIVSVREASRALLNAQAKDIQNSEAMEKHIQGMALAFQNFNASQTAIKLHKPLKFNQNGVYTFLAKNNEGDWRFIEKEGFKKKDEPLTWDNYKKAIQKLADHNNVVADALEMKVLKGQDLNAALDKVFKNQEQLFKKYVKVVNNGDIPENNTKIIVNEDGKKINGQKFDANNRKFQRDVGHQMENEQILSVISSLSQIPDAGNIRNTMGAYVDGFSLAATVEEVEDPEHTQDILAIYERSIANGRRPETIEESLQNKDSTLEAERRAAYTSTLVSDSRGEYDNLPKGMSPLIDQKYDEVNSIFKVMQRINLSDIPYWENLITETQEQKSKVYGFTSEQLEQNYKSILQSGGTLNDLQAAAKMPENHQGIIDLADRTLEVLNTHLDKERIKANILQYQFGKFVSSIDSPTYGNLAFNKDESGNFIPFETKADYDKACQLVENKFAKANAEKGTLTVDNSEIRLQVDAFVESNYKGEKTELNNIIENVELLNSSAKTKLQFIDLDVQPIGVSHLSSDLRKTLFNDVLDNLNKGLDQYSKTADTNHLDEALTKVSKTFLDVERQSGLPVTLGNVYLNELLAKFAHTDHDAEKVRDPLNGVILSDRAKLDAIKDLGTLSFSNLSGMDSNQSAEIRTSQIDFSENLASGYTQNEQKLNRVDVNHLSTALAGEFSLINLNEPTSNASVSNVRFGLNLSDPKTPYKIIKFDVSDSEVKPTKVLHASSFQDAKKEAFVMYQTNTIGGMLGISNNNMNQLAEIAQAIREGDDQTVKVTSNKLMGIEFTIKDVLDLKVAQTEPNKLGNKDYLVNTPDSGTLRFDPIQGADLINQTALIHQMTQTESELPSSQLIQSINNLNNYADVQRYLNPTHPEAHELATLNLDYPSDKDASLKLSTVMTEHALQQLKVFSQAENKLINPVGSHFNLTTTVPKIEGDQPISRIVPSQWISNIEGIERNRVDLNISPIGTITGDNGKFDTNKIQALIHDHVAIGDNVSRIPSSQITMDAVLANPTKEKLITPDQKQILFDGGLHGVRPNIYTNEVNNTLIAVANLEVALTNMPSDIKQPLLDHLNGESAEINQNLRLSMTKQKGIEIPQLAFTSIHDRVPQGHVTIQQIGLEQLADMLKKTDFKNNHTTGEFSFSKGDFTKLEEITQFHTNALNASGFDPKLYQDKIIDKFKTSQPEAHTEFLNKFPKENLTIDQIESTYAQTLVSALDQARRDGYNKDEIYLSFGKEEFLPQLILSTKPSVDSIAIDSKLQTVGDAKGIISSLNISVNYLPKSAIIDQLQPTALPNDQVNETSLSLVRQNFIEQFSKKADIATNNTQIAESVDSSKLYTLNDGENTIFALASSKQKIIELVTSGATAAVQEVSANNEINKNILGKLADPEYQGKDNLIAFVRHIAPSSENAADTISAIPVLSPFKDATETSNKLISQKSVDNTLNTSLLNSEIKTEFPEPLVTKYTPNQVMNFSGAEIKDKIEIDKIWPKVEIGQHIASQHQNLDTILLGRAIRNMLPTTPELRDGLTLTTQASSYVQFINEVHKGVSTAKTSDELVDNFQKAVFKTNVYNADFFAKENNSRSQDIDALVKAAYQKNNEGVPLGQSLSQNIRQTLYLQKAYNNAVQEMADIETLTGSEKSFINYLNGPVLNATGTKLDTLNTILSGRLVENRNQESKDLGLFELKTPNSLINSNLFNLINSKSTVDYDSNNAVSRLKTTWGMNVEVAADQKIFEKGYIEAANNSLIKLHTQLGGDEALAKTSMSLGDTTLEFGSYKNLNNPNFISFIKPSHEQTDELLSQQWVRNLTAKIEYQELQVMNKEELSKYNNFVKENEGFGLIGFVNEFNYKPKSDALIGLNNVYEYLKNGEADSTSHDYAAQIKHQASLVEIQKDVAFKRTTQSYDSYDDDMRHRTFFVENYASQYVSDMSSKQDDMFKKIESKMSSISEQTKGANDLYDFNVLSTSLDKVTQIPLPTTKSVIDKYAEKVKDSTIAKNEGYSKEDIVSEIVFNLERKSPVFQTAQDLLAARATHKFIDLMDKYAPENVKNTPDYLIELNKYFNLGESGDLKPSNFKTEFGRKFEAIHEDSLKHVENSYKASPDELTANFLNSTLKENDKEAQIFVNSSERAFAHETLAKLTIAVHSHNLKNDEANEIVLNKSKEVTFE